jgi:hypothetical protein
MATGSRIELERVSISQIEKSMPLPKAVRLLGVSLSALQIGGDEPVCIENLIRVDGVTESPKLAE